MILVYAKKPTNIRAEVYLDNSKFNEDNGIP